MAWNESDHPRNPKDSPNGRGGTFKDKDANGDDADLNPVLYAASGGLRDEAKARTVPQAKSPEETRRLLDEAADVRFGPDGVELVDQDGGILYRDAHGVGRMDAKTMRDDKRVQQRLRAMFRDPLADRSPSERRDEIANAFAYATPYSRRVAIDDSPNRRYLPADTLARSFKARTDRDQAVNLMAGLFYEDANKAADVIRNGFPDDRASAMAYINKTKFKRYRKDVVDKATKQVLHHKGDVVKGEYKVFRGKNKGKTVYGPEPNPTGAAGRSYLYMMHVAPTNGCPTVDEARLVGRAINRIEDPVSQAKAFHQLCYGVDEGTNAHDDDVSFEMGIQSQRRHDRPGVRLFEAKRGNGNWARAVAYRKSLSRDGAIAFLAMTRPKGDHRKANTPYTRRKRVDGVMRDVTPARLTEMRSFLHGVYAISSKDVDDWVEARSKQAD